MTLNDPYNNFHIFLGKPAPEAVDHSAAQAWWHLCQAVPC